MRSPPPAKLWGEPNALQTADHYGMAGVSGDGVRQQGRLVVTAHPQADAMERHGHKHGIAGRIRQSGCDQPTHQLGQADPATMLEPQDQLARSFGVERGRGDPVMPGWMGDAGPADAPFRSGGKRQLASYAGGLARQVERVPARCAQSGPLRDRILCIYCR